MNYVAFEAAQYPQTAEALAQLLGDKDMSGLTESIFIQGGTARSALLEATIGVIRPVRDLDFAAIGDRVNEDQYNQLRQDLNPDDAQYAVGKIPRAESIAALLATNVDFTINQAVMLLSGKHLVTSDQAIRACEKRVIQPTAERTDVTKTLHAEHNADPEDIAKLKRFRRNQTGMPARGAYLAAVLKAAGVDFKVDMADHPMPRDAEDAHTFFLGLMVNKALMIDEIERGPGDITATQYLFGLYDEMSLTNGALPTAPEDIVAYCEVVNDEHPQMKFRGSQIASLVKHTDKEPAPRIV